MNNRRVRIPNQGLLVVVDLLDDEPVVHKSFGDSFEATDLEGRLAAHHVGHLVITGAPGGTTAVVPAADVVFAVPA